MDRVKYCSVKGCFEKHYAKSYCEKHYANMRRHGYPIKHFYTRPMRYKIDKNGCFNCISHKPNRDGYPMYRIRGKTWIMSRFIYTEMFGEIPDGLVVRHKCDNPRCVNPEHLETGTVYDNNRDMLIRGRVARGSKHPNSILNEADVINIKRLLKTRKMKGREIAKLYGINERIVSDIKCERGWKHVEI